MTGDERICNGSTAMDLDGYWHRRGSGKAKQGQRKMKPCCTYHNLKIVKTYDPQPKNKDGSIRFFLYRWDDGKNGVRRLDRCPICGALYLVQAYHLNKFSQHQELFEDYYAVNSEQEADHWNRTYTGVELEHRINPSMRYYGGKSI